MQPEISITMNLNYLSFEQPIAELEAKIEELQLVGNDNDLNIAEEVAKLRDKSRKLTESIYSKLSAWQIVQVARHPHRPYTLDYIQRIFTDFEEMHGDRHFGDDNAIVGGIARLNGKPVMVIGEEKGRGVTDKVMRNFGMPKAEGYRKALRLMETAERFNMPVLTLIDTPGAYPGLEAEERGQGEAIARNLLEMCQLKVPVICIIIGEGASGGALGIGVGDKVHMLENTWYSVISPESCSSILWRSWNYKQQAAEALKLTSEDMFKNKLVDNIIKEPEGGAHYNPEEIYDRVRETINKDIKSLSKLDPQKRIEKRIEKFCSMGVINE